MRVDQIKVDRSWIFDRFFDGGFGNFIKGDAALFIKRNAKGSGNMPRNGFPFTVRVRCEENLVCRFGFFFELLDDVPFTADVDIVGGEVVFNVNTKGAFRQVADVTFRGDDFLV